MVDKAMRIINGWFGDSLVKNTAIFWLASLGVSFINYLYYPVLGRVMKPADFGEVQTVISIYTQTAVFFQVLALVGIGVIAKYAQADERQRVLDELSRLALTCSALVFVLTVLFAAPLAHFFHFYSVAPFLALAAALVVSVPLSFANSYLQGHKRFMVLSAGNLMAAVAKLALGVLFVWLGLATFGAIGGLVCAQLLGLAYALKMGEGIRHFVAANLRARKPELSLLRPELPYAGMVLVTSLATNLMLSFDILVIKHYFAPEQAGLYSGISIISNIVFFLTSPIAGALVPSIRPAQPAAANRRLLLRSLGLSLVVGGAATLLFTGLPNLVVGLLLGSRFVPYAMYLPGLAVALFFMSLVNLIVYYHIGMRNYWIAPAIALGLVITLGAIAGSHASMGAVVTDLVFGGAATLGIVGVLTVAVGSRRARA